MSQSIAGQREQIGKQLRALYQAGTRSQLKLLLNQQDSTALARNLRYYDYLYAARREQMQVYVEAIHRFNALEQEITTAVSALQAEQATLEQEQANLVSEQEARRQLIASADADLQSKGSTLEQMEQDRRALQKVIERIERQRELARAQEEQRQREEARRREQEAEQQRQLALQQQQEQQQQQAQTQAQQAQATPPAAEPAAPPPQAPERPAAQSNSPAYSAADLARLQKTTFAANKGKLPWPARGKLVSRFGEQRQGSVNWDGLRIHAPAGSEVRAVYGGRVMYADWLRGQGMLLVLDHGGGFMSLYAHNDVLLREPGEWVQPGDAIARVGNSGGEKEPALYFEIRQNGQPVNPLPWLGKP